MNYPVNEIFDSIQGEATFTGTPAIFVRMQFCDVGCAFCDTKHTWKMPVENRVSLGVVLSKTALPAPTYAVMTTDEIADSVAALARGARHVVLTGGEPATFDLRPLCAALQRRGFFVQVETSGTKPIQVTPETFVTVSPKIAQAGGLAVLQEAIARANEIKHPTATQTHLDQLQELLARGWHDPTIPVWLQPLSESAPAIRRCYDWCLDRGYRLSLQTHKYLGVR